MLEFVSLITSNCSLIFFPFPFGSFAVNSPQTGKCYRFFYYCNPQFTTLYRCEQTNASLFICNSSDTSADDLESGLSLDFLYIPFEVFLMFVILGGNLLVILSISHFKVLSIYVIAVSIFIELAYFNCFMIILWPIS